MTDWISLKIEELIYRKIGWQDCYWIASRNLYNGNDLLTVNWMVKKIDSCNNNEDSISWDFLSSLRLTETHFVPYLQQVI